MKQLIIAFLIFPSILLAQASKQTIVEHITNTRCSICGNTNPKFYNFYKNRDDMIHISYHPSSPYSTCLFNQHNTQENDDRVKYYNAYGSTPKFVVNGSVLPTSSSYNSLSTYEPFLGDTTPFSMYVAPISYMQATNEIYVEVTVTATTNNSNTDMSLFVALTEDTVFYAAPNGEDEHIDVFRKSLTNVNGDNVPDMLLYNDSYTTNFTISLDSEWDQNRINVIAILQNNADKSIEQSIRQTTTQNFNNVSTLEIENEQEISIYPNPSNGEINLLGLNEPTPIQVQDLQGRIVLSQIAKPNQSLNISNLLEGYYILKVQGNKEVFRIIKN